MRAHIVFVGLLLFASSARAQETEDDRARVFFDSGRLHFEEGGYERALEEFESAYRLSPRPVMLYNIGMTQERLALLDEAAATFERYLREVPDATNAALVRRRVENLRRRLAARAAGEADPGALADGDGSDRASGGGGDGLVLGGAIALGAAGAALVVFAIGGGLVIAEDSNLANGCYARRDCTEADFGAVRDLALMADIAWPIAAGAAVVGVVLLVLGLTSSSGSSARVTPMLSPTVAGLAVGGAL